MAEAGMAYMNKIDPYLLDDLSGCYLITGATGFLGGALVRTLLELNATVWSQNHSRLKLLVRAPGQMPVLDGSIKLFAYDPLKDVEDIGDVDYIIHCAGICDSRQFATKPLDVLDVNLISTRKLLEYARHHSHIKGMVFVSSGYIYSPEEKQVLEEDRFVFSKGDITDFSSSYIVSKIASECYCKGAYAQDGVPVTIIRPFNIYGPGLNLDHGGILTEVLRAHVAKAISMKSDGQAVRNFVYIEDVVSSILYCLAVGARGESYNVCGSESITVAGLVDLALRLYREKGLDILLQRDVVRAELTSDSVNFFPSNAKLKDLGWRESVTLETGMRRTIDYYVGNVKLGRELPTLGFGTWKLCSGGGKAIYDAIALGFRYIDTAQLYGNETEVGEAVYQAIRDGLASRGEVFIGTKLENDVRGYQDTIEALERSLERLQLEYVDMFMLHWPKPRKYLHDWQTMNMESWRAMEESVRKGKIRSLVVCNFLEHHLKPLLEECEIKPCVNQLELHPYYWQDSIVEYCGKKGILVQSWSPIANGKCLGDERLVQIGERYHKNTAQLCIKYACSKGTMPIVKATSAEHQKQNLDINWELEEDDIVKIDMLRGNVCVGRHPDDE